MRPHSAYRDSGVEWLGELPQHWVVRPFRYVCRLAYGDSLASEVREFGDVPVFGSNGVVGRHSTPNTLAPVIVVGRKGSHGEVNFSETEAFAIDTTYFVDQRHTASVLRWLYYILQSADLGDVSKDSAVPGLSREDAYEKRLPLPPLDEQREIVAFLDRETERIDSLIAKKRLLIERLQEYRTALITRTVTRGLPPEAARAAGLDPSPRLKPSGVEWLGDVPEHWELRRLSNVVDCLDGRRVPLNAEERADRQGEFPYWGANGVLDHIDDWLFNEALVLLGEDGAPFFSRNKEVAFAVEGRIWVNNHAHVLLPRQIQQEFLAHLLNITAYAAFIDGSTRDKLTQSDMNEIPVLLPPGIEQSAIASYLGVEVGQISRLLDSVESAIERLQEYRSALITGAVTGKIDVRGSVAKVERAESRL